MRVQQYKEARHKRIAVALSRLSAAVEELKTGAHPPMRTSHRGGLR
jgi:hypothetical protein